MIEEIQTQDTRRRKLTGVVADPCSFGIGVVVTLAEIESCSIASENNVIVDDGKVEEVKDVNVIVTDPWI